MRFDGLPHRVLVNVAVSLGVGVLLFLSCADFDIWPLTWFALVPLLFIVLAPSTRYPWLYGLLAGIVANAGGFYWMVGFFERFGHLPRVASIPIFLLLVTYQAITFALFAWVLRRLRDHAPWPLCLLAPITYVAVELVVPYVFPWYLSITQAWVRPVIQIAELTGPLGVSGLLVLSNAALYELVHALWQRRRPPLVSIGASAMVLCGCLAFGQIRIAQITTRREGAPRLKVGVVQANIGITEKWTRGLADQHLAVHQDLTRKLEAAGAELVIWPESSYPYSFARDQRADYPDRDPRRVRRGIHGPLLIGSLTIGHDSPYPFNSALLLSGDGDGDGRILGRFDKNILMVFGEYIPYYERMKWFQELVPETSNFARGTEVEILTLARPGAATVRIAPMICYEDIFPSFGRRLPSLAPNLLVNITNDAWFGRSSEPWEHMALSVYRAVELRLDLVRAVNTGVSTVIDATGRVVAHTESVDPAERPAPAPMTLLEEVALLPVATLYARLGEWFGASCLVLVVLLGLRSLRAAGRPVRWRDVGLALMTLTVTALAGTALFGGSGSLGLALDLLLRRPIPPSQEAAAFSTGLALIPAVAIGCAVAGAVVGRIRGGRRSGVELALAVSGLLVVPAGVVGRLEGEQASLVLGALGATLLARVAERLASRRREPTGISGDAAGS